MATDRGEGSGVQELRSYRLGPRIFRSVDSCSCALHLTDNPLALLVAHEPSTVGEELSRARHKGKKEVQFYLPLYRFPLFAQEYLAGRVGNSTVLCEQK